MNAAHLVDSYTSASSAYVRYRMTPRWRPRKRRRRLERAVQLCAECDQLRDQLADPAKPTPPPLFDLFAAAYDGEPAPQPATVEHEGRAYDAHDLEPVDD